MDPKEILYQYWGHKNFRPVQEEIIQAVLKQQDTLALLPTGGGKSICFQVPALLMDGLCLVITPLIALMKDQVESLTQKDIPALLINSTMNFKQVDNVLQLALSGKYKFLYLSPERLETRLFLEYLPALDICLIAVDEAHCISQWGYDFRPAYLRIAALRNELPKVPVLAVTASATKAVQKDICEKLCLQNPAIFQKSFSRPNLSYSAFRVDVKINKTIEILQKVAGSAIVYCKSRKRTQEICELLCLQKIDAAYYHAGLDAETRMEKQQQWIDNKIRVMVCTNAFGMGIDKPNVRIVIHYDLPNCIENYYQEAGRAGRDEKKAYAVLLYQQKDIAALQNSVNQQFPDEAVIKNVYLSVSNYLQLTYGSGEGQYFDFDLTGFCQNFKLDMPQVINCLKVLEQEAILSFSAAVLQPATLQFTCDKNTLFEWEQTQPQHTNLIKTLLRTYAGIFDYPVFISEKNLAYLCKEEIGIIKNNLKKLHQYGIIEYKPVKDTPQLYFIKERLHQDNFAIDGKKYRERKEIFIQRIQQMIAYTQLDTKCRSNYISAYFGMEEAGSCGICDICLQHKKTKPSADLDHTIAAILHILKTAGSVPVQEIKDAALIKNEALLLKGLNLLMEEEKIKLDNDWVMLIQE